MGQSSKPSVTQTSQTILSPEQKKIADLATPYAEQYAETPIQQYTGSGIAGFNPNQLLAQLGYQNAAPTAQGLATQSADTQSKLLDPSFMLDAANNPYVKAMQQSIETSANHNLQANILPGLRSDATAASGPYSSASSRDAIREGQAIGQTNQGISDATAKLFMDNYTQGLGGLSNAVARTGTVQGQQLVAPDILGAVGGQQQNLQQQQLNEQIKKFYDAQALPLTQAQTLMQLIQGMPGGQTQGQVIGAVPTPSPLQQGIGGLGVLGSLLSLA